MKLKIAVLAFLCSITVFANGESISPNMSLVIPAVGTTVGPVWAGDINTSLGLIDSHDHTPGHGVQIPPSGLDLNSDVSIQGNNLTDVKSVNFSTQSSPVSNSSVYENGVDLFFVDGNGNNVRLTQSGSVAGATGSISGLVSPASASYVPISSTFVWQSDVNTAANLDAGCLLQRDLTAGSNAITLCPPAALSSNYSITWPGSLPASKSFVVMDSSGNISTPFTTPALPSVQSYLTLDGSGVITTAQPSATNLVLSASSGAFQTNSGNVLALSVTITTSGKPVFVSLIQDQSATQSFIGASSNGGASNQVGAGFRLTRDLAGIADYEVLSSVASSSAAMDVRNASSSVNTVDIPGAGTHTYSIYITAITPLTLAQLYFVKLMAYEH